MRVRIALIAVMVLAAAFAASRGFAASEPTVSDMQIIHDSEPVGNEIGHDYTFIATSTTPAGECYYELSFFDAEGTFIGYTNGMPDLSLGTARCNGSAYLTGIAASYEVSWQNFDSSQPTVKAKQRAKIAVVDLQMKHDPDPLGNEYSHDFTFKATGSMELGEVYYEIAFFNAAGKFIGYSNGMADFRSGSYRCTGTAYLQGIAKTCDISWQ